MNKTFVELCEEFIKIISLNQGKIIDISEIVAQRQIMDEILKLKKLRVFVVEILRNGDREAHSYIIGVYSSYKKALNEAKKHLEYRAGKYSAEIHENTLDSFDIELYRRIHPGDEE